MTTSTKNSVLLAVAKTIKGTTFVGVRNYENKQGEISNQTIVAGITYENCLLNDFKVLQEKQNEIFETLQKNYPIELIETAFKNVYNSLEKRLSSEDVKEALRLENDKTIALSDAQKNAYKHLAKGVKLNKETLQIHIFGLVVKKTILQSIEYKETKSRELTIVQNKIKKLCQFKQDKYRNFIFDKAELKLQGIEI
jgi:hypothetical protein